MNGVHDMGGMQDMGPIHREKAEPVFHAPWEKRVFALMSVVDVPSPTWRYQIESIPPADYLRMSYYERWLAALGPLLTNAGMATSAEVESGKADGPGKGTWHVVSVAEVATWIAPESNTGKKPGEPARFHQGQRVRARNMNPVGHTRLPRYARGKTGTVERDHGVDVFPDTVALGLGEKPQHVYSVRFAARELWGGQASPRDFVYIDMWEDYLEPA
ncbi:MAG TPA: nitrile hydratase subunit beta [Steroidobacteraceae bacterium]|nr:nitrile hydratase subunit beta [Steroidobacteraceae bacterium]